MAQGHMNDGIGPPANELAHILENLPPPSYEHAYRSRSVPGYTAQAPALGSSNPPVRGGLRPTDPREGDSPYIASMREWARSKQYARDDFDSHRDVAEREPADPFKLFKWAGRKITGKKAPKKEEVQENGQSSSDAPEVGDEMDANLIA
jgi:hypothetical protein